MKTKLIKLQDKFILVSDEKLKDGDWFYNTFSDNQPLIQQRKGDWITCFNQHKIIAGIPELPSIDFSLLSEEIKEGDYYDGINPIDDNYYYETFKKDNT